MISTGSGFLLPQERRNNRLYGQTLISRDDLKVMLDEYYTVRGWNLNTGSPTREKLVELGLDYVADQLSAKKNWVVK